MKNNSFFLIFIITLISTSCNFYKPTVINAPILKEKGDLNLGVSLGSSTDLNASYAVTENIAVLANAGNSYKLELTYDNLGNGTSQRFEFKNNKYEVAGGYFDSVDDKYFYNAFLGYGIGTAGAITEDGFATLGLLEGGYGADFQLYFIQTGIHAKVGKVFHIGLVGKINRITFNDFYYSFDPTINNRYVVNDNQDIVGQIALDLNWYADNWGAFGQLQFASNSNNEAYATARKTGIHLGVYLKLGELFK